MRVVALGWVKADEGDLVTLRPNYRRPPCHTSSSTLNHSSARWRSRSARSIAPSLDSLAEIRSAGFFDVVVDRLINEAAAVALLRYPVNELERLLWEGNIDAFAHGA
jgi:hypothetical protein